MAQTVFKAAALSLHRVTLQGVLGAAATAAPYIPQVATTLHLNRSWQIGLAVLFGGLTSLYSATVDPRHHELQDETDSNSAVQSISS